MTLARRTLEAGRGPRDVEVVRDAGALRGVVDGTTLDVSLAPAARGDVVDVIVTGPDGPERAVVVRTREATFVHLRGRTHRVTEVKRRGTGHDGDAGAIDPFATSPMTGVVLAMHATPGARFAKGATLFVVHAMKMEFEVEAPADLVVREVKAAANDRVDIGQQLVTFDVATGEEQTA